MDVIFGIADFAGFLVAAKNGRILEIFKYILIILRIFVIDFWRTSKCGVKMWKIRRIFEKSLFKGILTKAVQNLTTLL